LTTQLAAAASGSTLHLVWMLTQDGGNTYRQAYRRITNHGATVGTVQLLDWPGGGALWQPNVAASGGHVYVAGGDSSAKYVRHSADDGVTFGAAITLPNPVTGTMYAHDFIANGADVYMARWGASGQTAVLDVHASHDYGATYGGPARISSGTPYFASARLGLTCDGVRVLWLSSQSNSELELYTAASHDGGATLSQPYWLGGNIRPSESGIAFVTSGDTAYALLRPNMRAGIPGSTFRDTFFVRTSPNDCAAPQPTATATSIPAASPTSTATASASATATTSVPPTATATPTPTATTTVAYTMTPSQTSTRTPTSTATSTQTPTATFTTTPTTTPTPGDEVTCGFFDGFEPPVDNPDELNIGRAGRTYPIKWRCSEADGTPVDSLNVVLSLGSQQVPCARIEWDGTDALEESTSGNSVLRYDLGAGKYIFNWQTPQSNTPRCYVFVLRLTDGSVHTANFMLRP
jgi:hypothetical protein